MRLTALEDEQTRTVTTKLRALGWTFVGVLDRSGEPMWCAEKPGARVEAPSGEALLSFIELEQGIERRETRLDQPQIRTGVAAINKK